MKRLISVHAALALVPMLGILGTAARGGEEIPVMGKPATVNPYNGMQEREEKFEFAQKPQAKKDGDKWTITFATTAACDATVSIVGKDGSIVRHLASGVLGKNAPYPFQQNSLSQKLEWDGLTTDYKKADPAGCTVRVSLGLKPQFERSIFYDPNELMTFKQSGAKLGPGPNLLTARGKDGSIYVIDAAGSKTMNPVGRVFDKDGKYVKTFFPPPAAVVEQVMTAQGHKQATTVWGDKVLVGGTYGSFDGFTGDSRGKSVELMATDAIAALKAVCGDVGELKEAPRPTEIPATSIPMVEPRKGQQVSLLNFMTNKYTRMTADRKRDEIYFGYQKDVGILRANGKTGELDPTWYPKGDLLNISELSVDPESTLHIRIGLFGWGQWVMRLDHEGKPVPFSGPDVVDMPNNVWTPGEEKYGELAGGKFGGMSLIPAPLKPFVPIKVLWTGETHHNNTHTRGLYASPNGLIVAGIEFQEHSRERSKYLLDHGLPKEGPWSHDAFVALMDRNGNYYSANAVGATFNGHNVFMDRDGNIYSGIGGIGGKGALPFGIKEGADGGNWGGLQRLVKFQWTGKVPVTTFDYAAGADGLDKRPGTLWSFPGLTGWANACTCHNNRSDMDYWARTWANANYLNSIVVLDANGNMIGRFGRYGNVDDTDTDVKEGRDGLRFAWIRVVAASDSAVYAIDPPNRRILRAEIKYAAEESVPVP